MKLWIPKKSSIWKYKRLSLHLQPFDEEYDTLTSYVFNNEIVDNGIFIILEKPRIIDRVSSVYAKILCDKVGISYIFYAVDSFYATRHSRFFKRINCTRKERK
jgi:hypothetical protein